MQDLTANTTTVNFVITRKTGVIFRLRKDYGSIMGTTLRIQSEARNKQEERIGKFELASSIVSSKFPHRVIGYASKSESSCS